MDNMEHQTPEKKKKIGTLGQQRARCSTRKADYHFQISLECFLFDLMANDLAVLRQGLHPTRSTSGSVAEILELWEHRVVKTKRTEVSGAPGRQGRKVVCQQYQLLLYLRNRSF